MLFFLFLCVGRNRDIHVLPHSFPPRRSSDLVRSRAGLRHRHEWNGGARNAPYRGQYADLSLAHHGVSSPLRSGAFELSLSPGSVSSVLRKRTSEIGSAHV